MKPSKLIFVSLCAAALTSCVQGEQARDADEAVKEELAKGKPVTVETAIGPLTLPPPYHTESVRNPSRVIEWPEGKTPMAPAGFVITRYADGLQNPRTAYVAPNKDVFVVESDTRGSANRITLLRDTDQDGKPDERTVFLKGLDQPYGMLILDGPFYVANTNGLWRYPYEEGATSIDADGKKILDLPAGGYNHHWTRNLIVGKDGKKIYVTVGSASNVGEYGMDHEKRRAAILEINPDGSGRRSRRIS